MTAQNIFTLLRDNLNASPFAVHYFFLPINTVLVYIKIGKNSGVGVLYGLLEFATIILVLNAFIGWQNISYAAPVPNSFPKEFVVIKSLPEPLIEDGDSSEEERTALNTALHNFNKRVTPNADFPDIASPLVDFINTNPNSAWRLSILVNLGLGYYRSGYYSLALDAWEKAWKAGHDSTEIKAIALTDRAIGELAKMHARLGHKHELERLFADLGSRAVSGPATEMITGAHEGLWRFRNEPETAVDSRTIRCALEVKSLRRNC
jgi:hypothetical protein